MQKTSIVTSSLLQSRRESRQASAISRFKDSRADDDAEMYPQFFHKTDKLGRPLYIMQPGVKDVPALLKVVNEELLTKNFVATVERVIRVWPPSSYTEIYF